ncbi:Uncharacterised protein [Mycobacterium tuberculosis]|nr:Uncharacterised protein [Mycobacterium tuberculosis]CKW48694.1 Uncharacterised protein [Mycobacterium tuberculosis]
MLAAALAALIVESRLAKSVAAADRNSGTAITNDIGHLRTASGQTDVSRVYCHSGSAVAVFA